jgi:hypothetical protein
VEDCDDGRDNDGDGRVDCQDEDCAGAAACQPTAEEEWTCAPWPPSEGRELLVAAGDVGALVSAVNDAQPGDVILLEDGTYPLAGAHLWIDTDGVSLRSASGRRDAVVLDGGHQSTEIVTVAASDVTVADLSIVRADTHAVHVVGAPTHHVVRPTLYNLNIVDPAQQGIKVNQTGDHYADDGLIACSSIVLTAAGRSRVRNNCYTGGIDMHRTRGWRIRDNRIEGFWCPDGLSEHGIHLWRYNADAVIERNVVVDCARGIGLGLVDSGSDGRVHPDIDCPTDVYVGDFRGTIRNNLVFASDPALFASAAGFDNGISLASACDARVLHNTVASTQPPFSSIEWRFAGTSARIGNNLVTHNLRERTPGTAQLEGNIEGADHAHFADLSGGDLHLSADSPALDAGSADGDLRVGQDFEGDARDGAPDVGADEVLR